MARWSSASSALNKPLSLCVAELELGLKRDAVGAVDGSSLEALLKGETLERRGPPDPRAPEDNPATPEPVAAMVSSHTSSGRIRKVRWDL